MSGAGALFLLLLGAKILSSPLFFFSPQNPAESVSLLSSSLIGQCSSSEAPLMSLPALMTKPGGQYLDLTLL